MHADTFMFKSEEGAYYVIALCPSIGSFRLQSRSSVPRVSRLHTHVQGWALA